MSRSEAAPAGGAVSDGPPDRPADLRLLPSAAAAWAVSILTPHWPAWMAVALALALAVLAIAVWRYPRRRRGYRRASRRTPLRTAVAQAVLVGAVATAVTCAHVAIAWSGPVPGLSLRAATVRGVVQITADPVVRESTIGHGSGGSYVVVRARLTQVSVRGASVDVRTPVVLTAPTSWARVVPGERIAVIGRLSPTTRGGRRRRDPQRAHRASGHRIAEPADAGGPTSARWSGPLRPRPARGSVRTGSPHLSMATCRPSHRISCRRSDPPA